MTTTTPKHCAARRPALPRATAMRLAATEYQRVIALLESLQPEDWTKMQVEERASMRPADIVSAFTRVAPKAARGRRWAPGFIRRRPMPQLQVVNGQEERWSIGYLLDVILTRDPWMHRIDIARATGGAHLLTAEHDGVLVDDIVYEWAERHGQPFALHLSGPAGGTWIVGTGGLQLEMDVMDFCRAISGRRHADGPLATEVPV